MLGVKVAIQTKCLAQPLRQALHTAARLEADGVQFDLRHELSAAELSDTALRQLRKLLDDLNLRVASTAFPTRRGYAEPQDLQRRMDATLDAMQAASRLHSRVMLIALGALPPVDAAARATLVDALATLAMHGNRLGVQLALQTADAAPAEVQGLLEQLPEGLVGVDVNPAELIRKGASPKDFIALLGPHVVHMFANDAVRGLAAMSGTDVALGRGTADVPELLAMLEEYGYRGWVTIDRTPSPRAVEEAGDAVRFLRSL
jgi:sugar phosphate isomerase/epimerase